MEGVVLSEARIQARIRERSRRGRLGVEGVAVSGDRIQVRIRERSRRGRRGVAVNHVLSGVRIRERSRRLRGEALVRALKTTRGRSPNAPHVSGGLPFPGQAAT